MRFYFVRHGESHANLKHVISNRGLGEPLTERGQAQARELAAYLQPMGIRRLVASPLLRARETAEIVAGDLGLSFEVDEALREYDCGVMEGRSDMAAWAAYERLLEEWFARGDLDARLPQGESLRDQIARLAPLVARWIQKDGGSAAGICLVGHGGLYRCALPALMTNVDWPFALEQGVPYGAAIVAEPSPEVPNGAFLTCLSWGGVSPPAGRR